MGFGLMALGFVFLFNPAVCIYDILPDFIGYILIFRGLLKTEIAFSSTEKMRRMFMNLTWIGVIKFIASIILYFGVKGAADDDASALVFTFVACDVNTGNNTGNGNGNGRNEEVELSAESFDDACNKNINAIITIIITM